MAYPRTAPHSPPRSASGTHPTGMLSWFSVIFTQKDGKRQRKKSRYRFRWVWMNHHWECISYHRGRSEHLLNLGSVSLCSADCQWVGCKWKGQLGATNISILNRDVQSGLSLVSEIYTHWDFNATKTKMQGSVSPHFYRPQGKVMFSQVSVYPQGVSPLEGGPLQTETPIVQRSHLQRLPLDRAPSWQRLPWNWHLVVATAGVGTHPTGMHSCSYHFFRLQKSWEV